MIGIRKIFQVASNTVVTSSTALVTVGLTSPIAANQTQKFRAWIPVTVGATGGLRLQVVVPAGGTLFLATVLLVNTVAPSITSAVQTSSAAFTNALANAGNHFLLVEGDIVNGANAGNIDIQMAQNTSDVNSLTVLKGGALEVVTL